MMGEQQQETHKPAVEGGVRRDREEERERGRERDRGKEREEERKR
jgi:hypothetical protein